VTGRSRLWLALVVAVTTLGCTKLLMNRCDQTSDCKTALGETCNTQTKTCMSPDAGSDANRDGGAGKGGAGGAGGAAGSVGGAGGAMGGQGGAGGGKAPFTCPNSTCISPTPICDVDAGACLGCDQVPGACGSPNGGTPVCVSRDAGVKPGMCVECLTNDSCKGAKPICEVTGTTKSPVDTCRACGTDNECKQLNTTKPVCVPTTDAAGGPQPGSCVGCLTDANCTSGGATRTPICEPTNNACRACAKDTECGGPGVCMADGHCAATSEVLFVDATASCSTGNGTSAAPYCSLAVATPHLGIPTPVMVILGGTNDQLTLATTGVSPVIIGRKNAAGDAGSIPANAATAITVSSDTVLIRNLIVDLGSGTASKGITVGGAGTSLSLRQVTVYLGTKGLGIDAESGATLTMDECYVLNNPTGGILVNGATASIQNTIIAANPSSSGYGIQFNAPGSGTQFLFNTVVGYSTAATSDFGHQVVLNYSIVVGSLSNCNADTCVVAAPTFNTTNPSAVNPFHLTGRTPCPTQATSFPNHDIDGDPRTAATLDCGADEFVQ
jgi:hypothetical protein